MAVLTVIAGFVLVIITAPSYIAAVDEHEWSPCHGKRPCSPYRKSDVCIDCRNLSLASLPHWTMLDGSLFVNHRDSSEINTYIADPIKGVFGNSANRVTHLYLDDNNIQVIPENSFTAFPNLVWLELGNNKLTLSDNPKWLRNVPSIDLLDFSSNCVSKLANSLFSGLSSLRNLYMWENNIEEIEDGWTTGLVNLRHLILSFNKLRRIQVNNFRGLPSLNVLNLQANQIVSIQKGWSQELKNLANLDLSYNKIWAINVTTFANLTSLHVLNLKHNNILFIEPDVFSGYKSLEIIFLSYNSIENISDVMYMLPACNITLHLDQKQWAMIDLNITENNTACVPQVSVEKFYQTPRKPEDPRVTNEVPVRVSHDSVASQWLFWILLGLCVVLIVLIVNTANSLHRIIVQSKMAEAEQLKMNSNVYRPSNCTLSIHYSDEDVKNIGTAKNQTQGQNEFENKFDLI